jgi:hypothetical protein
LRIVEKKHVSHLGTAWRLEFNYNSRKQTKGGVKMIQITVTMMQDKVIELLESYVGEDFQFRFMGKTGIQLKFEVSGDATGAAKKAKELIKGESWGSALFFQSIAI